MARTNCILSDDDSDPPPFVLDQHVEMHLSSATSLKLQIAGRHITLLGLSRFRVNQYLFLIIDAACLADNRQFQLYTTL